MSFDPTKPVQTRDGREAGIYATDGGNKYPIHGYHVDCNGDKSVGCWTKDGLYIDDARDARDLVNEPEPVYWSKPEDFPPVCWMMRPDWPGSFLVEGFESDLFYLRTVDFHSSRLRGFAGQIARSQDSKMASLVS